MSVQLDEAARPRGDGQLAQLIQGSDLAKHADGLFAAADLHPSAGSVEVEGAERIVDLCGGEAARRQPVRIDGDVDLAVDAANPLDLGDALTRLQGAADGVVDEPGQVDVRHRRSGNRIGDDGGGVHVDATDQGLVDVAGQDGARLVDAGAHVVGLLLQVDAHVELDRRGRDALHHSRGDVVDVGDAGERILHRPGDLGFQLPRGGAVFADGDHHQRELHIGELLHRQRHVGNHAGQDQG
jgi:hypothetical protein